MIRHLFVAALRNLAANKLQSAIAIIGLSIGITAALLMALVIRNQLTFDHFIPGYERTYRVVLQYPNEGRDTSYDEWSPSNIAETLVFDAPEIEAATRMILPPQDASGATVVPMKQGEFSDSEIIYWADPNLFDVLPLPGLYGDVKTALHQPDGVVLPRSVAEKYFRRDDVVGQTIQVDGHPMIVRAVIADLPANGTSLKSGIFVSGRAFFSPFTTDLKRPFSLRSNVVTYVRLRQGASVAAVEQRLPALAERIATTDHKFNLLLIRLDQIPLFQGLHPGAKGRLVTAGMTGAVILLIAAINFVNLLTATATRRGIEVGIRKVCGAAQRMLMLQFLGEAILTVFFATCVAVAFSEWLLPVVNAFLTTGGTLDYGRNPWLAGSLLAAILALGLLAGAWPAFILSSFRPVAVLKGVMRHSPGADQIRNALVILQFAILIGLVVASWVIYQQDIYITRDALRADIDQVLVVRGDCKPAFRSELRDLPGVAGVSCTSGMLVGSRSVSRRAYKGRIVELNFVDGIDPGIFALYGIKPLAGSLPSDSAAGDYNSTTPAGYILNRTAVQRLGFASAQAAIGQSLPNREPTSAADATRAIKKADKNGDGAIEKQEWDAVAAPQPFPAAADTNKDGKIDAGEFAAFLSARIKRIPIIAVVPDFSFLPPEAQPADEAIAPTLYHPDTAGPQAAISIKLNGKQVPETLASIDQMWAKTNPGKTIDRYFLNQHMQEVYLSILRQAQLFAVFSCIAIFLACFGLLGLSVANTERRTKEIGIRKALGANSGEVTSLLLWDFVKPVLWANLIAWPVAYYFLHDWLSGFAYHVALSPLVFVGATVLALTVALLTVAIQSTLVARQKPVLALRYE